MKERDDQVRLQAGEVRDEMAIRKEARQMAEDAREMTREIEQLARAEEEAERSIEDEWRREHWGHEPERAPSWERPDDDQG